MSYTSRDVYEYISKQTNDLIVEWKTCRVSGQPFPIYQSDLEFYTKISPTLDGKTFQIPTPTLCPEERQRRRLLFRNERKLYKRKCDATGESIISVYAPYSVQKVYGYEFWLTDNWDPLEYAIKFDYQKSFSEQYTFLFNTVPSKALVSEYNENCDYTSICGYCKDCYFTTGSEYTTSAFYSHILQRCTDIVDCSFMFDCESCFACHDLQQCFHCHYLSNSKYCTYCYNSDQLTSCSYCISCSNLNNKQYCIENIQYTKEAFDALMKEKYVYMISKNVLGLQVIQSEQSYGSLITHANNVLYGFDIEDSSHIKYSQIIVGGRDMCDCSNCYVHCTQGYEIMSSLSTYNNIFCAFVYNCSDCIYTTNCNDSTHLFGCANLKNKQYCIFNRQYTKYEYEKTVAKIITHMQETPIGSGQACERGEFFHPSLSPFGYNETVANEYFPLSRTEALARGYKRQDNRYDPVIPEGVQTLTGDQIPEDITVVSDDILKKILICEVSGRPYRIIKQELEFYRKHHLPLPRKHPDVRHEERMKRRPGRTLYLRSCDQCGKEMLSVYPADPSTSSGGHIQTVYCEECYKREVYG